jgi:hypothetical protein
MSGVIGGLKTGYFTCVETARWREEEGLLGGSVRVFMQVLKGKRPWSVQVIVTIPTAGNHFKICSKSKTRLL